MRGRQRLELAQLDVTTRAEVDAIKKERDLALKHQLRQNPKSFQVTLQLGQPKAGVSSACLIQDPWTLHYAAAQGEMSRLELLLERYRERSEGDMLVVRALMEQRDRDTGRTALHFASRAAKVRREIF